MECFEFAKDLALPRLNRDLLKDDAWLLHAETVAPDVFHIVNRAQFGNPMLLQSFDDLDDTELTSELQQILERPLAANELVQFKILVTTASSFSNKRRRLVLKSFVDPTLLQYPIRPDIYTERDLLPLNYDTGVKLLDQSTKSWPSSSSKLPARDKVKDRDKAAIRIGAIVREAQLPAADMFLNSVAPERLLGRLAGGRRTSTLLKKIHEFQRMRDWMLAVFHIPFPQTVIQLADYLEDRAYHKCGPTVPSAIVSMVSFFEDIGGKTSMQCVGSHRIIKAIVADIKLQLTSDKPTAKRKAAPLFSCMLVSWECMVVDNELPYCQRLIAWVKLIRVWAALRSSDTAGIPIGGLSMNDESLSGVIEISKTTGATKKIGLLHFHVSSHAWFARPNWLETGFKLLDVDNNARSYLLPVPAKDLQSFTDREPTYDQLCNLNRKLLSETSTVLKCAGEQYDVATADPIFIQVNTPLLIAGSQIYWTEHSDRATLVTWSRLAGVSKEDCDLLGRWSAQESTEYFRASKKVILRVQHMIAMNFRSSGTVDVFGERLLLDGFSEFLKSRNVSRLDIREQCMRLESCRKDPKVIDDANVLLYRDHAALLLGIHNPVLPEVQIVPQSPEITSPVSVPEEPEPQVLSHGSYVLSLNSKGLSKTLHRVGSCWRMPGLHYVRFEIIEDDEIPTLKSTVHICFDCFPKGNSDLNKSGSESDSSDDSSSSDSSTQPLLEQPLE